MEHDRKSFLFYGSYLDAVQKLKSSNDKLELLLAIANYGLDQKQPKFNSELATMAWVFIKPLLDANYQNYLNGCKGGAPSESMRGNQNARKSPKQTQNKPKTNPNEGNDNDKGKDNVNANDNDNVNVNDNENVNNYKNPYTDEDGYITDWDKFYEWRAKHPTVHEEDE